ncbi:MAG: GTP 3',8-cyclase MoaA [Chloroflexota bacterium]
MSGLSDSFQRPVDYLRVSVTDRCNMRCVYCVPPQGVRFLPRSEVLSYEEIRTVVEVAAKMGISKVRLSGGEPLVRIGITALVRMLASVKGIDDISLTTNGLLLSQYAAGLKEAGLRRVNVSLDTLRQERFSTITGHEGLDQVLHGLKAAREAGLNPVKVNMVVMRGINDDEVGDFALRSIRDGWHVRFIELMPFTTHSAGETQFIGIPEVKQRLEFLGPLEPFRSIKGNGPARYYRFSGATGTIGFISPVSEHFCFGCNRLRLTADGRLRPCLLNDHEIDVKSALRGGDRAGLERLIREAVASKPRQHLLTQGQRPGGRAMTQIGG